MASDGSRDRICTTHQRAPRKCLRQLNLIHLDVLVQARERLLLPTRVVLHHAAIAGPRFEPNQHGDVQQMDSRSYVALTQNFLGDTAHDGPVHTDRPDRACAILRRVTVSACTPALARPSAIWAIVCVVADRSIRSPGRVMLPPVARATMRASEYVGQSDCRDARGTCTQQPHASRTSRALGSDGTDSSTTQC